MYGMRTRGDRVRHARKQAGLSQEKLAQLVGLKQATISDLESGESKSTVHLVAIAAATGFSAEWLDTGEGSAAGTPQGEALAAFMKFPPHIQRQAIALAKALMESEEKP